MDWSEVLGITGSAAALSTIVSTLAVFLVRWRARPEPGWAVLVDQRWPGQDGRPAGLTGRLTNAGDGLAFRVAAGGAHCQAEFTTEPAEHWGSSRVAFVPYFGLGHQAHISVRCAETDWDRANVLITWTRSPTRRRKRKTARLPLRQLAEPAPARH